MKKNIFSPYFLYLAVIFHICLIVSNIYETKLIEIGGVPATGGLLLFPITYILNDCIAEVWGYSRMRLIIWSAFAMSITVALLSQLLIVLPPAPYWEHQEAFAAIFGQTPRIAVGSFMAFLVGSFLNAFVMSKMKVRSQGKHFSVRAVLSTLIGETADSFIFFPIAFGGIIPWSAMMTLVLTQIALKTLYEILILPVTIRVVKWVKRKEGVDVFDKNISYHVLKVKDVE